MLSKAIAGLLFLISGNVLADQFPAEIIEYFNDIKVVVYVNESDIEKAPAWNPTKGAPPLTIGMLIKDVQEWNSRDPNLASMQIHEIELKPIRKHEKQDRWYYLVHLTGPESAHSGRQYLAVLMDGKIVPAIREPASFK
ncbi:MAG: hypothetical protein LJE74_08930 [Proteobacteria bacterium]|jgi:hypothetical protein|nr:hypothetical protein [Pseudomonadota bacterium]